MKLIIAGSRSIKSYATLRTAILESGLWRLYGASLEVVSGKAPGMDTLGEEFAKKAGLKVHDMPAEWGNVKAPGAVIRYNARGAYNALAGHWRNEEMAKFADLAIIVWDGSSTGSLDMVHRMIAHDKPVYLYPLRISTDLLASLEEKGVTIIYPNSLTVE